MIAVLKIAATCPPARATGATARATGAATADASGGPDAATARRARLQGRHRQVRLTSQPASWRYLRRNQRTHGKRGNQNAPSWRHFEPHLPPSARIRGRSWGRGSYPRKTWRRDSRLIRSRTAFNVATGTVSGLSGSVGERTRQWESRRDRRRSGPHDQGGESCHGPGRTAQD